jgi:hypothetical protein
MSVLACSRLGCENIMCDRYSYQHRYYICYECFDRLVALGPGIDVEEFMNDEVYAPNDDASRAYWNEIFPFQL